MKPKLFLAGDGEPMDEGTEQFWITLAQRCEEEGIDPELLDVSQGYQRIIELAHDIAWLAGYQEGQSDESLFNSEGQDDFEKRYFNRDPHGSAVE